MMSGIDFRELPPGLGGAIGTHIALNYRQMDYDRNMKMMIGLLTAHTIAWVFIRVFAVVCLCDLSVSVCLYLFSLSLCLPDSHFSLSIYM